MTKIDTLCVIDDDEIYTYSVKRLVTATGLAHKAIFFENGQTAIDFFNENKNNVDNLPELILLDLNMPVLDGWQFMEQFVKLIPELKRPIIVYILSSSIDEDDYMRAKAIEEISGFIIKPINTEIFRQIILDL